MPSYPSETFLAKRLPLCSTAFAWPPSPMQLKLWTWKATTPSWQPRRQLNGLPCARRGSSSTCTGRSPPRSQHACHPPCTTSCSPSGPRTSCSPTPSASPSTASLLPSLQVRARALPLHLSLPKPLGAQPPVRPWPHSQQLCCRHTWHHAGTPGRRGPAADVDRARPQRPEALPPAPRRQQLRVQRGAA